MPWRDVIFTGDGIILPPCTQSGLNGASSFATGGIVLPPSISEEERVLLDLLATETHVQAKPRWKADRVLLEFLAQNETHVQAKPWSPANATGEAHTNACSTTTTTPFPAADRRARGAAETSSCTALRKDQKRSWFNK
ncbi:hypothetical protein T484DRAFT_1890834 [Baffinella frigidus]|nr:hypothetical protein T484DRAFT_1890834 [Cryptophyta sp. CCMP2293]